MGSAQPHMSKNVISSNDVQGTNVYSMNAEKIGEIDHLMIDKPSGRVNYAVMSFGGFLGMGQDHYPIPWSSLKYDTSVDGYVTGITAAQLKGAPTYDNSVWGDRNWETDLHKRYNAPYYW